MSKQIFKKTVPKEILFNLLEKICIKTEKYYFFDINSYKKLTFYELHTPFCEELKEYYHIGKQEYINRKMTYNAFTTIVRQICKSLNIMYASQIKYNKSKYNIVYFIYL
jgi:hypothetical protein